ncbi:triosephosphate isomerase [Nocardiopsis kunsanensis]|uniref:Triosephosphate isomerase n=1 Tax=Nocardiopsis kunsanensis TaxID=141693 RepID=A0A918X815_9ACTN|nr:triose-phosphate isomerase [Nocardiopsis kunsanensis]GHD16961.1 triosephosphate isomerase [Nocardiopsis kunsanensis]
MQKSKLWIGTSWKMNKTLAEAREYADTVAAAVEDDAGLTRSVEAFVIPSHTAIATVAERLGRWANTVGGFRVGAQNAHWQDSGAWTGEVSMPQIKDAGATMVEIGHSERRTHFHETVETTRFKVESALRHGLVPLLCIGEPAETRDRGHTCSYILAQARGALAGLQRQELAQVLIAYEPRWAIGALGRPARGEELAGPFAALRSEYGGVVAGLLYGGSVTLDNMPDLLALEDVDGLFVGRAAWHAEDFVELLRAGSRWCAGTGERQGRRV